MHKHLVAFLCKGKGWRVVADFPAEGGEAIRHVLRHLKGAALGITTIACTESTQSIDKGQRIDAWVDDRTQQGTDAGILESSHIARGTFHHQEGSQDDCGQHPYKFHGMEPTRIAGFESGHIHDGGVEMAETSQVKAQQSQSNLFAQTIDFQSFQISLKRHLPSIVHQSINGVFEIDGVVFLQGARFFPHRMKRQVFLGSDEPVYAALKGVTLAAPGSGNASRIPRLLQHHHLKTRPTGINRRRQAGNPCPDDDYSFHSL